MTILYIHQYFKTPEDGGGIRSYYLAKRLVDDGHEVVMFTTHNQKTYKIKNIEGIKVHYFPVYYRNKLGYLSRLWPFLKFVFMCIYHASKMSFDLAYVMTTPLTTGLIALHFKFWKKKPYFFEVGDLWPEVPIQMKVIKSRLAKKVLYAFERKVYQRAEIVIALSPAIEDYVKNCAPHVETSLIYNMADCNFFDDCSSRTSTNTLRIAYIGTLGRANHLIYLLDLARATQGKLDIEYIIMGEGYEEKNLKREAQDLHNLKIIPWGSKSNVKEVLRKVDAVYLSFLNLPVLGTGSPNKYFDGLAAGKMIISNFTGWVAEEIENNQSGFYYNPAKPEDFITKIRSYLADKKEIIRAQESARKLALEKYEVSILTDTFSQLFKEK